MHVHHPITSLSLAFLFFFVPYGLFLCSSNMELWLIMTAWPLSSVHASLAEQAPITRWPWPNRESVNLLESNSRNILAHLQCLQANSFVSPGFPFDWWISLHVASSCVDVVISMPCFIVHVSLAYPLAMLPAIYGLSDLCLVTCAWPGNTLRCTQNNGKRPSAGLQHVVAMEMTNIPDCGSVSLPLSLCCHLLKKKKKQ